MAIRYVWVGTIGPFLYDDENQEYAIVTDGKLPGGAITLGELQNVVLTNPQPGQVLTFDGTNWVNDWAEEPGVRELEVHGEALGEGSVETAGYLVIEVAGEAAAVSGVVTAITGHDIEVSGEAAGLDGDIDTTKEYGIEVAGEAGAFDGVTITIRDFVIEVSGEAAALDGSITTTVKPPEDPTDESVTLATDGTPAFDITTSTSDATLESAERLKEILDRITGASFTIRQGSSGTSGIFVGTYQELASVNPSMDFSNVLSDELSRADEYIIKTHNNGVYIVGAAWSGVRNGVYNFLYNIGYRQFYPYHTWEHVPDLPTLTVYMNEHGVPSFLNRNAPRPTSWTDDDAWDDWRHKNCFNNRFGISTGHAYAAIIRRNQEEFDANPEWEVGEKFRMSAEGLVDVVMQDAVDRITADPSITTISMDPSDGSNWPMDEEELNFKPEGFPEYDGSHIPDRVMFLASKVSEAINDLGLGEKFVGIYAYAAHTEPCNIQAHPNVIVNIATSYSFSSYTVNELFVLWGQKVSRLGVRDFYDTFVSSQAMPRRGKGGNVNYIRSFIPFAHAQGARFNRASPTDSWPINGLGYYLAARMQWDVGLDYEAIIEDFLDKAYGSAKEVMREYHDMVSYGADRPRTESDIVHHMYRILLDAVDATTDQKVLERIYDCILYTRYAELHFRGINQTNAPSTYKHTYRMKTRMITPKIQLYRHYRRSGVNVTVPPELNPGNRYTIGETKDINNPDWESNEPFTEHEILSFAVNGMINNEPDDIPFDIIEYDMDTLEPAYGRVALDERTGGTIGRYDASRGDQLSYTWSNYEGDIISFFARRGTIYLNRGPVRFFLDSPKEVLEIPVAEYEVESTSYVPVTMPTPYSGVHKLYWQDGNNRTHIGWTAGQRPWVFPVAATGARFRPESRMVMFFYVPKGTTVVGGYTDQHAATTIRDGNMNVVEGWKSTEGNAGYFAIDVPEGTDGKLWRINSDRGFNPRLMTVPPLLTRDYRELMLPKSVIDADDINKPDAPTNFDVEVL